MAANGSFAEGASFGAMSPRARCVSDHRDPRWTRAAVRARSGSSEIEIVAKALLDFTERERHRVGRADRNLHPSGAMHEGVRLEA